MDEDFSEFDAFAACSQRVLHAFPTDSRRFARIRGVRESRSNGSKIYIFVYLLMTETPHNLLQKTTPLYTDPAGRIESLLVFFVSCNESSIRRKLTTCRSGDLMFSEWEVAKTMFDNLEQKNKNHVVL